jgi:RND family efflux transporter MFP subunit
MNGKRCGCGRSGQAVLIALSIPFLGLGCSQHKEKREETVRPVRTMLVTPGGDERVRSFPGKVEASVQVQLSFQVPGFLVRLPVKEGQNVTKGELVAQLRQDEFEARLKVLQAQLDSARVVLRKLRAGERPEERLRLEAQVRAAEARLSNARTDFNRLQRIAPSKAVAAVDVDRARTAYRVAQEDYKAAMQMLEQGTIAREEDIEAKEAEVHGLEARVVEANLQLKDSTLHAPYDGVIAKRFVEQNQNIKAKEPILQFQNVDEIEIGVDVPETVMAADIRSADIVKMVATFAVAPDLQLPVHIKEIAQAADPVTQTFKVRVGMKAPMELTLRPGMTATVTVTYRRARILGSAIVVPIAAVFKDDTGEQIAWAIESDGTVTRRPVKIGEATGGQIQILDGLQPGDRIAVAGVTFLREGMRVRDLGGALGGGQ